MTIFHLHMTQAGALRAKPLPAHVQLVEIVHDQPAFNRFLYQLVGQPWRWFDKLNHSEQQWQAYVCRPQLRTWVAYVDGAIAGYFELEAQQQDVEIKYFGLTTDFIGQGIGGGLLSAAIEEAWRWPDTQRVWVHTCSDDHPSALGNYQARGFEVFRTEAD